MNIANKHEGLSTNCTALHCAFRLEGGTCCWASSKRTFAEHRLDGTVTTLKNLEKSVLYLCDSKPETNWWTCSSRLSSMCQLPQSRI